MANTALWDQQISDIYTLTNRPDLDAESNLALRQATLRAHLSDKFFRDIVISPIANNDQSQGFTNIVISTTTEFVRFRDVLAVQLLDVSGNVLDRPVVDIVEIGDIYEPNYPGVRKSNVAWLAGTNLNVYTNMGAYGANVTWFQSPILDPISYDSWIAQLFPDVLVWEAAQFIWNRTGNDSRAAEAYKILHGDPRSPNDIGLYSQLKANFLTTAGR